MKGQINIISCGIGQGLEALNSLQQEIFNKADYIFASRSLLEEYKEIIPQNAEIRIIASKAREDAKAVLALAKAGKNIIALASGDALYNGFGSSISDIATKQDSIKYSIIYHPNITAFQALFHRLGLPWSKVQLFSAHSGSTLPLRPFVEAPFSVIYGGTQNPVHAIAQAVLEIFPNLQNRPAVVAEKLATKEERIISAPLYEIVKLSFHPTSILLLLEENREDFSSAPSLALGMSNDFYEKENNLITSSEVRAIALSKLQLPTWGVLWDIGAGSGSVGLEAAALCPNLEVHAVEQKESRLEYMLNNQKNLAVLNYTLHHGEASTYIKNNISKNLPRPDCIFIGGGGLQISQLVELCFTCLKNNGRVVVSVVTTEAIQALYSLKSKFSYEICCVNISLEQKIAGQFHHLKPQNTIYLFTFKKEN